MLLSITFNTWNSYSTKLSIYSDTKIIFIPTNYFIISNFSMTNLKKIFDFYILLAKIKCTGELTFI